MRLRKTAVGALVSLTLLLGWAGFYFRDPPAPPSSIEFTPAYQNEGLLKRAWALPVARLYGPDGYPIEPERLWSDQHCRYLALRGPASRPEFRDERLRALANFRNSPGGTDA